MSDSAESWRDRHESLRQAGDMLFEAADALLRSKTTSEELRRAKDLRAALDIYKDAR